MERKIGEIFEFGGEWYQCVGGTCRNCSFYYDTVCKNITAVGSTTIGNCHCSLRTDHKSVIFKKLEKVGEPYEYYVFKKGIIQVQDYLLADPNYIVCNKIEAVYGYLDDKVVIETKQNKEDMEENHKVEDTLLTRLVGRYVNNLIDYEAFEKAVKELYSDKKG